MLIDENSCESSHKPWVRRIAWLLLLGGLVATILSQPFGRKALLLAVPLVLVAFVIRVICRRRRRVRIVEISLSPTSKTGNTK